jgi:molybdenum cofactor synthesis domain-containing protein
MPKEGIFCRVVRGGAVARGDPVDFLPRTLRIVIVTVSDRASRGEYEDLSGPRIRERLEQFLGATRWHARLEAVLVPDEAARIRAELEACRDAGVDLVFTTGGTGVGPRDVTPEVVTALADKLIPGIMEHIRVLYGQAHPRALLSRGVAAVLGRCLVYTLPGSRKAVDEYLTEILKTVEHLLFTVHGLDRH